MPTADNETEVLSMRDRILEAATALFKKLPVSKITMADIAREAGIVRSTVYKVFANKEELLNALFALEMRTNHHPALRKIFDAQDLGRESLVDMFLTELNLALDYVLLSNTFDAEKTPLIGEIVLSSEENRKCREEVWLPILEEYEKRGLLRTGLDLKEIMRWMTYQHVWFISHPTLLAASDEERRHYVETFIFGAIVKDA